MSEGDRSIEVGLRPERNAKLFKEAIDRGYVHIRFTDTRGGTEIGVRLNGDTSDFSAADFENGKGTAHVEGNLTLDYVKVKCIADVDLSTLKGKGRLVKVEAAAAWSLKLCCNSLIDAVPINMGAYISENHIRNS